MRLDNVTPRLIIGISGASGVAYGVRVLEQVKNTPIETHAIVTKAARRTLAEETAYQPHEISGLADFVHPEHNIGASVASGSFKTMGMIVAPCSIKSMSDIALGLNSTLLSRAADVVLKERRKLVLMVRETPLHGNHLRRMADLSDLGAIIAPPVPGFYTAPQSLEDLVDHTVGRVLDLFEIETGLVKRWEGKTGVTTNALHNNRPAG